MIYYGITFKDGQECEDFKTLRAECLAELREQVVRNVGYFEDASYCIKIRKAYSKDFIESWDINSFHPILNFKRAKVAANNKFRRGHPSRYTKGVKK